MLFRSEAGREEVGKKGIVKEPSVHQKVIQHVIEYANHDGFVLEKLTYSPITGGEGNIEFLGLFVKDGNNVAIDIERVVETAHNCFKG